MNFYNYIFYKIYKSISGVNKFAPEMPTIIWLSLLIMMNVFSGIIFFKIPLEKIGLNNLYIILTFIFVFNFSYFIRKKKYIIIIENYDKEKRKFIFDYAIAIYPFFSFFLFFKSLKIDNSYIFIMLTILLVLEIYKYLNKDKD